MPLIPNSPDIFADRIQLPFQFDPDKMLSEVENLNLDNFIYYNVIQLKGPAHIIDPTLPFPPPAEDNADGSRTEWMDAPCLK